MTVGKVWLVGAGPGDPGLITVRGLEVLRRAEVVLYDTLAHPALLEAAPQAEQRDVGKRYGSPGASQAEINRDLIAFARAGRRVVRLKGGDPLLFARGAEEALALAEANVPFEIVPGISSPVAAAAYAGISLTHRDLSSSTTFITGSDRAGKEWSPESWKRLATATDTVCILMGMRRLEAIAQALIEGGRSPETPSAVIQWGARPEQRVVTARLADIAQTSQNAGLSNPAVIVVGEVVRLRESLRWYDTRPLFGRRVLVPRPAGQAERTAQALRERGAEPRVVPVIEIAPPTDPAPLESAAARLSSYDWVLFTSANGVEHLFSTLRGAGRDARAFGTAKIGVIGPRTAEALERYGVRADRVAEEHVGEGLARDVLSSVGGGAPAAVTLVDEAPTPSTPSPRVLILRALVARDALPNLLREAGCEVDVVAAYETRPAAPGPKSLVELVETRAVDTVLFTSSSTVTTTVERLGSHARELLGALIVASIGPITTRTAEELGIRVDVTAATFTVDGLLDALESHFEAMQNGVTPGRRSSV